jgi:hypothetical protein
MSAGKDDQSGSDLPANIGKPATRALIGAGYMRLDQLTAASAAELLKLHGVGPKAIERLRVALGDRDLMFADEQRAT